VIYNRVLPHLNSDAVEPGYPGPPAQIPACGFPAPGSYGLKTLLPTAAQRGRLNDMTTS